MFRASRGDRADVQNVAVIVTDGNSNVRAERTVPDAIEARVSGVHIVVVAVGTSLNTLELRGIASQPTADTLLTVDRIRDLPQLTARLDRATCNGERGEGEGEGSGVWLASQPTADTQLTVDRIRDLPQLAARLDRATCNGEEVRG